MSSSPKRGRIVQPQYAGEDVFVLGQQARRAIDHPQAVATASALVSAAEARGRRAEAEAEEIIAEAHVQAASIVEEARRQGFEAGRAEGRADAETEVRHHMEIIRRAAEEGRSIRDGIVEQSAAVIARAAMLVVRRIVGDYYDADPAATATAAEQAARAASTQQILSVRVHPSVVGSVQARLADLSDVVVGDSAIEIGGCVVDVAHGSIDATLEGRVSMMEMALQRASGSVQ
jgi:flagellar assembly protein FliH